MSLVPSCKHLNTYLNPFPFPSAHHPPASSRAIANLHPALHSVRQSVGKLRYSSRTSSLLPSPAALSSSSASPVWSLLPRLISSFESHVPISVSISPTQQQQPYTMLHHDEPRRHPVPKDDSRAYEYRVQVACPGRAFPCPSLPRRAALWSRGPQLGSGCRLKVRYKVRPGQWGCQCRYAHNDNGDENCTKTETVLSRETGRGKKVPASQSACTYDPALRFSIQHSVRL